MTILDVYLSGLTEWRSTVVAYARRDSVFRRRVRQALRRPELTLEQRVDLVTILEESL